MLAAAVTPQERPVFRGGTDVVSVTVAVSDKKRPITGLTRADFSLTDRGAPQTIDDLDVGRAPLDVTVIVEMQLGSTRAWWRQYRDDAISMSSRLRPVDRLDVILSTDSGVYAISRTAGGTPPSVDVAGIDWNGFGQLARVPQVGILNQGPDRRPPEDYGTGGGTGGSGAPTYDATALALIQPAEGERRRLVLVFTNGKDTSSLVATNLLEPIARRTEAVLYLLRPGPDPLRTAERPSDPRQLVMTRALRPPLAMSALDRLAEVTGGTTIFQASGFSKFGPGSYSKAFDQAFDLFTKGYVLRYRPRDVLERGWHDIKVIVPARPAYNVRARSGYYWTEPK